MCLVLCNIFSFSNTQYVMVTTWTRFETLLLRALWFCKFKHQFLYSLSCWCIAVTLCYFQSFTLTRQTNQRIMYNSVICTRQYSWSRNIVFYKCINEFSVVYNQQILLVEEMCSSFKPLFALDKNFYF